MSGFALDKDLLDPDKPFVKSWMGFASVAGMLQGMAPWACRGDPCWDFKSESSLDRILQTRQYSPTQQLEIEARTIDRFIQMAPMFLDQVENSFLENDGVLMLMQHHGAPTRLLDWTRSIWIAAFFASCSHPKSDGRLRLFDLHKLEAEVDRRFGAETKTHRMMCYESKYRFWFLDPSYASQVDNWIVPFFCHGPKFRRLVFQQGLFTMGSKLGLDHWSVATKLLSKENGESAHRPATVELRIPACLKPGILQGLMQMGITGLSLFPGIDGVGRAVDAFARSAHLDDDLRQLLVSKATLEGPCTD